MQVEANSLTLEAVRARQTVAEVVVVGLIHEVEGRTSHDSHAASSQSQRVVRLSIVALVVAGTLGARHGASQLVVAIVARDHTVEGLGSARETRLAGQTLGESVTRVCSIVAVNTCVEVTACGNRTEFAWLALLALRRGGIGVVAGWTVDVVAACVVLAVLAWRALDLLCEANVCVGVVVHRDG
jgi:hypothetical protein